MKEKKKDFMCRQSDRILNMKIKANMRHITAQNIQHTTNVSTLNTVISIVNIMS